MYKEGQTQSLFDDTISFKTEREADISDSSDSDKSVDFKEFNSKRPFSVNDPGPLTGNPKVIKIVWFFDNNSFEEYYPGK
jgi:hypothetical protein